MNGRLPAHAIQKLLAVGSESETPQDASPGSVDFGKYRLLREVGRGGMGVVYEAEDTHLGRRVALKVMPETVGLSAVLRRRFAREAQAAARLNHPNIAAVFEATPDFIAMQFVHGRPLVEVSRDDPRTIVKLVRDAALAVAYAHERGIVHRDLKPSNLLVERTTGEESGEDLRIYVMDFGLAKESSVDSSLSGSGNILGTPAYMSPEQALGHTQEVDARSDVYGLGATLHTCLKGEPPFHDSDVLGLLRKVVEDEARSPRIEPDLDAIVLKCLAKERDRRYQTARELADDLARWLRGETVRARPPSLRYRIRKFLGRHRAVVRAVALPIVVAAVVSVLLLIESARNQGVEAALRLSRDVVRELANAENLKRSGNAAEAEHRFQIAVRQCRTFLANYDSAYGWLYLGQLRRKQGRLAAAKEALNHALALDPALAQARFERGLVQLAQLQSAMAQDQLPPDPTEPETGAARAARKRRIESLRRAAIEDVAVIEHMQDVLDRVDVSYAAAEVNRLRGNLEGAKQGFQDVLKQDRLHVEARRSLTLIYRALGEDKMMTELSSSVVDIGSGIARAYSGRGSGGTDRETGPKPAVHQHTLADCTVFPALDAVLVNARKLAFYEPLSEHLMIAAQALQPVQRAADLALGGEPERALDEWQDAIKKLGRALDLREFAAGHNNRGVCWAQLEELLITLGRTVEAITAQRNALSDFDAAIRLMPDCPASRRNRALLRMHRAERLATFGRFHPAALELEAAIADLTAVLEKFPGAVATRIDRARAHARHAAARQRLDENADTYLGWARLDFQDAVRREPANPRSRMFFGSFLARHGDILEAIRQMELALRHAPEDWLYRTSCERRLVQLRVRR